MADSSWASNLKEFVAGTAGGVAQVLAGQPFDIIKVRQATAKEPIGAFTALQNLIKNEGALALYKGTLPPLMGVGACVSI
jgi:solute carrier family 25 carnitine/acylcarnitine transporter 20/29